MLASELDYHLPAELIAQEPVSPRDNSRLMRLQRADASLSHHCFSELPQLLRADDLLVFNDTRVLNARLRGFKMLHDAGVWRRGAQIEALLLREIEPNLWEALLKPSSRLRAGSRLQFVAHSGELQVEALAVERTAQGWIVRFEGGDIRHLLAQLGEVPLPPYIAAKLDDDERYQTVYARENDTAGSASESAAAPTAGLHFTPQLLDVLRARGIQTAFVTLGIGIGTFRPIKTQTLEEHEMHEEQYEISAHTAQLIAQQKARDGRVVAVGTTTTRVLEAAACESGVEVGAGRTSIFIRPGYRFKTVDALITNFHLPRSTLLAMIAAFAENGVQSAARTAKTLSGLQKIRYAYDEAIAVRYRFFSFGDAMLID